MNAKVMKLLEIVSVDEELMTKVNEINENYPDKKENAKACLED